MAEEIDFYRAQTGLPQGLSQQDYELAYFRTLSGLPVGLSIDDYKQKAFETATGYKAQVDGEYWYYANALGVTDQKQSLEDLKRQYFAAR